MICKLCNREFSTLIGLSGHISRSHDISLKSYYDKYLKSDGEGKCCVCGKPTKFQSLTQGYASTCSFSCSRKQGAETKKKMYGYIPGSYGSKEFENAMLDKYGVKNSQQNPKIREKTKKTNKERYGVEYAFLTEEAKEKSKVASQTPEARKRVRETVLRDHSIDSKINAQRRELSDKEIRKGSLPEKYFYEQLQNIGVDVIYNASSERYPFLCDFYLPSFDLFIELNLHPNHGGHWFDANSEKDREKVEEWKAKKSKYFDAAIEIWTKRDLKKKKVAEENKLSYRVLWSREEVKEFVEKLKKKEIEK